ncbi:MAG: HAD family hydrolase [Oscillospiraceae bacterium]|nr:HAD family hydrolase [Oscillospiraceae bacterium]
MLAGIKWIFFDLGSTLIDETAADTRRIMEMISGTDITEEAYREKRFEMIRKGLNGDLSTIDYFGLTKTPWHSEDEVPYSDVVSTLTELKQRGYKLGVIANQNYGTEQRLNNWNLLQFFDIIAASAELGMAKPDPAIFEWALKQADCSPQNAVMVGDRMDNDMAPANRLGIHTVRLKRGLGAYHEPQSDDEMPEYTISMLAELLDLL